MTRLPLVQIFFFIVNYFKMNSKAVIEIGYDIKNFTNVYKSEPNIWTRLICKQFLIK